MAKILVADDDEQYPIMLAKILHNDNHTVFIVKDGAEALKLCESQKFDLIITDIFMPNVDGIGLITDLMDRNSKVPIIAISGGGNMISAELNLQFADAVGAYSVLKKPFTKDSVKNYFPISIFINHEMVIFVGVQKITRVKKGNYL